MQIPFESYGVPGVSIIRESIFADGGYSAMIRVYGQEVAVSYVVGLVSTRGTGPVSGATAAQPYVFRNAQQWAEARVKALPAEFHEAHKNLYKEEAQ